MPPALRLANLRKAYGDVIAVNGLNIESAATGRPRGVARNLLCARSAVVPLVLTSQLLDNAVGVFDAVGHTTQVDHALGF